jgi:prolipoprotein diacylglyceryltransferase
MQEKKFHQKAYYHVKKHRKKYWRFVLFIIILSIFRIIEDYFLVNSIGVEFKIDIIILFSIIFIAAVFTVISEVTEKMIEKEEPKIEEMIREEKNIIKKKLKRKD